MRINIKTTLSVLALSLILNLTNTANATKLPNDVWKYVKTSLPNAQQRFDSVILLSDDMMYIPLYPPADKTVDKIEISYTYPQGKTLKQLPEVVLLNNGYSLLRVSKDKNGNYTLTTKDDLPVKVRLGLMPQDMLTPVGLIIPESLKLTLGDLLIPSKEESSLVITAEEKNKTKNPNAPTVKKNQFVPLVDLKDKKTYINPRNSKFLEVYDNTSKDELYELKLSSMPLKIVTSEKSKVALILYWSGKNVEILDLKDENIISTIQLDANANDVVLNQNENLAYVASQNANAIYVISLDNMQLQEVIKLDQKPVKLSYCKKDNSISFYDDFSMKVFNIKKNSVDYLVQPLGTVENVSKLLDDETNVYAISRTKNQIVVFDKTTLTQKEPVDIDKKPTDAILWNNHLYILCSKEGYMDVYSILENKIVSREQISKDGFYSKITLIPNEKNIIITGVNAKNYIIYNLDTMKVTKKQDSYIDVANMLILDKKQRL